MPRGKKVSGNTTQSKAGALAGRSFFKRSSVWETCQTSGNSNFSVYGSIFGCTTATRVVKGGSACAPSPFCVQSTPDSPRGPANSKTGRCQRRSLEDSAWFCHATATAALMARIQTVPPAGPVNAYHCTAQGTVAMLCPKSNHGNATSQCACSCSNANHNEAKVQNAMRSPPRRAAKA